MPAVPSIPRRQFLAELQRLRPRPSFADATSHADAAELSTELKLHPAPRACARAITYPLPCLLAHGGGRTGGVHVRGRVGTTSLGRLASAGYKDVLTLATQQTQGSSLCRSRQRPTRTTRPRKRERYRAGVVMHAPVQLAVERSALRWRPDIESQSARFELHLSISSCTHVL